MEIIKNNQASSGHSGDFVASSQQSTDGFAKAGHSGDFVASSQQSTDGFAKAGHSVITAIKPAVRDARRVNVFVDGEFRFSLDIAQLADFKLKVGQKLSEEKLAELISESNFGKLYQRTLEYVFSRPHSVKEVRDHLKNKQRTRQLQQRRYRLPTKPSFPISDRDIEKVISRLVDRGYLNDVEFAKYFIENRNVTKGISTKRLRLELKQKGVDEYIIEQALAENPRDQEAEIGKIIEKRRRRGYDDQKLIQYLLRQGFEYELVRSLVLCERD